MSPPIPPPAPPLLRGLLSTPPPSFSEIVREVKLRKDQELNLQRIPVIQEEPKDVIMTRGES